MKAENLVLVGVIAVLIYEYAKKLGPIGSEVRPGDPGFVGPVQGPPIDISKNSFYGEDFQFTS